MEKIYLSEKDIIKLDILSINGRTSIVYKDGDYVIKLFDKAVLKNEKKRGVIVQKLKFVNKNLNHFDELIYSSKYYKNGLFTKELNIYSQYILFFLDLLDINIGVLWYYLKQNDISIEYLFHIIGLDNPDIQQKVWKLFCFNQSNEYLEKDMELILDTYKITIESNENKRLVIK